MCIKRIITVFVCFQGPNNKVRYAIVGDSQAMEYFTIDPNLGTIALRKSLVGASTQSYTVLKLIFTWGTHINTFAELNGAT